MKKSKKKLCRKEIEGAVVYGTLTAFYFFLFWNLTKWDILRVMFVAIMFATLTFVFGFLCVERRRIKIEEEKAKKTQQCSRHTD